MFVSLEMYLEHPHQAHHVEKTESKPKKSENKKARKRTGKVCNVYAQIFLK